MGIEKVGLCNGHDNCGDGSDEAHCSTSMTVTVESTSGNIITVETLQSHTGAYPFHDRSYHFDSLGDFTGKTFIKYSNDDKMTDKDHVMTKIRTTEPTTVYVVKQTTNGLPWLAQEGFERVAHTGVTFSGQRSTRHKEWDTSLLTTDSVDASEVFSKTFAAGTISLPGNGEGDGAFLTFMEKASVHVAGNFPVIVFDQASPSLTVSPGTLSGAGQLNWYTAANSALQVSQGDNICGISFKCNTPESHLMIGLAHTEVALWRDLDYGVTCRGAWATRTDIYENGSNRNQLSNRIANGSPASDVHAIRVNGGGQVEYSVNGNVYFTSSRPVTYPWHVGVDTN